MVIKIMPLFYTMDARIKLFEFKKRVIPLRTYSAWEGLKTPGLDCFRFLRVPGNDWDRYQALRMPLTTNSISHFLLLFSNSVLALSLISNLVFDLPRLLMY